MSGQVMDIIIFGGQSNMQGQSEALLPDTAVANAWEYHYFDDEAVPLANPVGENVRYDGTCGEWLTESSDGAKWIRDHVLGAACYGHTNLVPAFCRAYLVQTGGRVLAVHVAKGSTTVADWAKGGVGYEMLTRKARAALRFAGKESIGHIYFVWLQGESDAIEGRSAQEYAERLTRLKNDLKADLGIEKFGIIRVGRFTCDARDDEIISAQESLCDTDADFEMLTRIATELNGIPEYMHPTIGGHYSAAGLEKLGTAAGETLGRLAAAPV